MITLPLQVGDKVNYEFGTGHVLEDLGKFVDILIEDNKEIRVKKKTLTFTF